MGYAGSKVLMTHSILNLEFKEGIQKNGAFRKHFIYCCKVSLYQKWACFGHFIYIVMIYLLVI